MYRSGKQTLLNYEANNLDTGRVQLLGTTSVFRVKINYIPIYCGDTL